MQAIILSESSIVPSSNITMNNTKLDRIFKVNELSNLNNILTEAMLSLDWQLIKKSLARMSLLPELSCFEPLKKQIEQTYNNVVCGIYTTAAVYEITDFLADNMALFLSTPRKHITLPGNIVTITQVSALS
jgi:hypothetical protein